MFMNHIINSLGGSAQVARYIEGHLALGRWSFRRHQSPSGTAAVSIHNPGADGKIYTFIHLYYYKQSDNGSSLWMDNISLNMLFTIWYL